MTSAFGRMMRSNSNCSQPLPTKWPGSFDSAKCPLSMAPRGKTECPKLFSGPRWQSTGSPACTVLEEKLGSSIVQCRIVPAGTISSLVAARAPIAETQRMRLRTRDFPAMAGLLVDTSTRPSVKAVEDGSAYGTAETPGDGRGLDEA